MKRKYYILLFLLIFLAIDKIQYLFFCALIFAFITDLVIGNAKIIKFKSLDWIVLVFLLVHIYGVILGFYTGNKPQYIISNFAGIFIYTSYYIIVSLKLDINTLLKEIYIGIYIFIILILIRTIFNVQILDNILGVNTGIASSGQERLFCPMIAIFGIFIGSAFFYLENKSFNKFFINLLIPVIMFFFIAASKGFALIFVFFIVVYSFLNMNKNNKLKILVIVGVVCLFYSILSYYNYANIVTTIFSTDDISNIARYEQFDIIFKDLNLFGHGLGAIFPDYIRDENAPYAIEMVYLNIFHKYGLFCIIYIYGFIYTFVKLIRDYKSKKDRKIVLELFGLMGYSIASLGNPMLFSPSFVAIHCIVLYYINYNEKEWFNG